MNAPPSTTGNAGEPGAQTCPFCGGTQFIWGFLQGHNDITFKADNASWLERISSLGGERVRARRCATCANIQLFGSSGGAAP